MEALTLVFSMPNLSKGSQQIILHSQTDFGDYPENTNTCFKNNLHSSLRQKSGSCPQIQLVGIYSTVKLSQIQLQLDGVKSYFFGSIHKGQHRRLHIGSASVEKHQYWEVKNSSYFDVDLSNLNCWSISIQDRDGVEIRPQQGASTVIELSIVMNPSVEAPKYLYFGSEPLQFPSFLKIKPKCCASLLSFSHSSLANVFPPHNEILIKQNCISGNEISCKQTNVLVPTDFYTLEKLVYCLNSKTLKYGIAFEAEDGRLKIAKNSIAATQLRLPKKLAELFGCKINEKDDFRLVGNESTFKLFDPLATIPSVLALKCSLLDKNGLTMVEQCLRLIYVNSKNGKKSSYDFEHKQPCLMTSGYVDSVSFRMETFPKSTPVYFAENSQCQFSGCLEIQHEGEI